MALKPTSEKLAESARGEDKPIDEKKPTVPFAMVAAYPIILVVALLALLAYFFLFR